MISEHDGGGGADDELLSDPNALSSAPARAGPCVSRLASPAFGDAECERRICVEEGGYLRCRGAEGRVGHSSRRLSP